MFFKTKSYIYQFSLRTKTLYKSKVFAKNKSGSLEAEENELKNGKLLELILQNDSDRECAIDSTVYETQHYIFCFS